MSIEDQGIQAGHAIRGITYLYREGSIVPNLVYIGVPDEKALNKALKKIQDNQVPHYKWVEPDNELGFTAIATIPLDVEKKKVFERYRLWRVKNTTFRGSSAIERQVIQSNLEVGGSIPSPGTNL